MEINWTISIYKASQKAWLLAKPSSQVSHFLAGFVFWRSKMELDSYLSFNDFYIFAENKDNMKKNLSIQLVFPLGTRLARNARWCIRSEHWQFWPSFANKEKWKGCLAHSICLAFSFQCIVFRFVVLLKPILCPRSEFSQIVYRSYLHIYTHAISKVDTCE